MLFKWAVGSGDEETLGRLVDSPFVIPILHMLTRPFDRTESKRKEKVPVKNKAAMWLGAYAMMLYVAGSM